MANRWKSDYEIMAFTYVTQHTQEDVEACDDKPTCDKLSVKTAGLSSYEIWYVCVCVCEGG